MVARFLEWIYKKININEQHRNVKYIAEGQVFWCSLGENIGYEQNGKGLYFRRPVLILKKFSNNLFWGVPMSTVIKDNRYYVIVTLQNVKQSALISQLRVLDSKRLDEFVGYISKKDLEIIRLMITNLLKN